MRFVLPLFWFSLPLSLRGQLIVVVKIKGVQRKNYKQEQLNSKGKTRFRILFQLSFNQIPIFELKIRFDDFQFYFSLCYKSKKVMRTRSKSNARQKSTHKRDAHSDEAWQI